MVRAIAGVISQFAPEFRAIIASMSRLVSPRLFVVFSALILILGAARPASADITGFLGLTPTPETRGAKGFAVGFGVLVIGFEFEYSSIGENEDKLAPSLKTGSGNLLVQTPIEVSGVQLYGTVGGGLYRERLIDTQETSFTTNLGGGAKIRLVGPLRLRLDYRLFRLNGDPLHQNYHRFYAGANIGF